MAALDFEHLARLAGNRAGATYGFLLEPDAVFFLHDSTQASLVSEAGSGRRFDHVAIQPPDNVCVAGDFNNWTQQPMQVAPRVTTQFGLRIALADIERGRGQFKFVINGSLWVEPPAFATNTADAGVGDPNSRNLVVVLSVSR